MKGTARSLLLGSILVSAFAFSACSDDTDEPAAGTGGTDVGTGGKTTTGTGGKAAGGAAVGGAAVGGAAVGGAAVGGNAPAAGAGGASAGTGNVTSNAGKGGGVAGGPGAGGATAGGPSAGAPGGGGSAAGAPGTGGATSVAGNAGTPGTGGTTGVAGSGTAGGGGTAGAGHTGLASLLLPIGNTNPGTAGAAGAAAVPDRGSLFVQDFGETNLQDMSVASAGTATIVLKVLTNGGNAGGMQFTLKNGSAQSWAASASMVPAGKASGWINFSDLTSWTTLVFDLTAASGSGSFSKAAVRYLQIDATGGDYWSGAVFADTTILIDSITYSAFTALSKGFESSATAITVDYEPVAGSTVTWVASAD